MNAWRRLVALLSTTEHPLSLALFRILLGIGGLGMVGSVVGRGIVDDLWLDLAHGGYRRIAKGNFLVEWLGGPSPEVVWSLVVAALLSSLCVVVGLGGRLSVFAALWSITAVTDLNHSASGSVDELLTAALFLCLLAPVTRTLSVDCWLSTRRWTSDRPVHAFPRWMGVFQILLVYWSTGLQKLSIHWVPGGEWSALYYILQQPSWHRTDMQWVAWVFPLTQLATGVTWFWEVGSPVVLLAFFFRHTRTRDGRLRQAFNRLDVRSLYALVGFGLHVSIHVTLQVGLFSFVSLAYYACLFSPDEWASAFRRTRARFAR